MWNHTGHAYPMGACGQEMLNRVPLMQVGCRLPAEDACVREQRQPDRADIPSGQPDNRLPVLGPP